MQKIRIGSANLTKREFEIFIHLVNGSTNRKIAVALGVGTRTIETLRQRMNAKVLAWMNETRSKCDKPLLKHMTIPCLVRYAIMEKHIRIELPPCLAEPTVRREPFVPQIMPQPVAVAAA